MCQLSSATRAAAAAAATLSMLAGPPQAGPQGAGPQAGPQGRPQAEPTWSRQLTKKGLLEILTNGLSDSTYGVANKQVTLARKLRELSKYLATLLPAENQTTSLVLAFTNKDAMLHHLAQMPVSNRHLGTTAFKNALRILQVKGLLQTILCFGKSIKPSPGFSKSRKLQQHRRIAAISTTKNWRG
jgi:ribosomal protein L25 (general stress protein Ctc)